MAEESSEPSRSLFALQVGVSRQDLHMEDRTLVSCGMRLFGVFDGVSSGGGGAQVATLAVDAVQNWVEQRTTPPTTVREAQSLLVGALGKASEAIAKFNRHVGGGARTSATTAAVLLIFQPLRLVQPALVAVVATVGDSRVQLWRDDTFYTLTLDHAYLASSDPQAAKEQQDRLDDALSLSDLADPLDRAAFTHRNLIASALDGSGPPDARYYAFRLLAGDRLLIDSDGIHDNLNRSDLADLVAESRDPQQTADALIEAAWEISQRDPEQDPRAKPDDMSVIVVDVPGSAGKDR
jgi:serine/threonine protein phosphatase PrpC